MPWAQWYAGYITTRPEYPRGARSKQSIANEIWAHCQAGIYVQAIEYFYDDLNQREKYLYGR
jgi:hypothetical protein